MSADTESGLAVKQLLKMVASGHLTNQQFKQLAQNVIGYDEEVPIQLEEDEETEAQAQVTAPPGAPAAMAANPTATEAGGGKGDKEDGEQDGGGGGGGGGGIRRSGGFGCLGCLSCGAQAGGEANLRLHPLRLSPCRRLRRLLGSGWRGWRAPPPRGAAPISPLHLHGGVEGAAGGEHQGVVRRRRRRVV